MATRNLEKKLSVTRLCGKTTVKRVVDAGGILKCGVFMGRASGVKTGETDFGAWNALTGNFRGIAENGKTVDSGVCFMPDVAYDLIKGQLDGGAIAVDFAFEMTAILDEESPVGFSYRASPMMDAEDTDPVLQIQQKLQAKMLGHTPAEKTDPATGEVTQEKATPSKKK